MEFFEQEYGKAVKSIDKYLVYLGTLTPSSLSVFRVSKGGVIYILKATIRDSEWSLNHLDTEANVLSLAKGLPAITHLVHDYKQISQETSNFERAILKEFFDGEMAEGISNSQVQKDLEETVKGIHSLGFARLELKSKNIILSQDKSSAKIIDLGYCLKQSYLTPSEFDRLKYRDLKYLKILFV